MWKIIFLAQSGDKYEAYGPFEIVENEVELFGDVRNLFGKILGSLGEMEVIEKSKVNRSQ